MARWRAGLALAGIGMGAYGVLRLVSQNSGADLLYIVVWLAAAVAIHDGLVSPAVLAVGRALSRVPARARRYVQLGLVVAAMVTVVALPLIYREDTQPPSKALLVHDYGARLTLLLALIAVGSLLAYSAQVARTSSGMPAGPAGDVARGERGPGETEEDQGVRALDGDHEPEDGLAGDEDGE